MQDVTGVLQTAEALLAPWTKSAARPDDTRLDIFVDVKDVLPSVTALTQARWGYLAAVTGLDLGVETGELEVLYHYCEGAAVVTVRARLPRDNASVDSICSQVAVATFYERELSEMFGITVVGTPNPNRMFLSDDWPAGVYPLRKDFNPEKLKK